MIVPQFWAEERIQYRSGKKQITVRRFGWSDVSQEEAQALAVARAKDAFQRVATGEAIDRREPKVPYNGAAGVPIREEILRREGGVIITRNSYGAQCLNTPDVLFADVDFTGSSGVRMTCAVLLLFLVVAIGLGWSRHSVKAGLIGAAVALLLAPKVAKVLHRARDRASGGAEKRARKRIAAFAAAHPDWRLRLYRTPAGFRVLAMHRTFDPAEPAVAEFFAALGTDPVYVRMCGNQHCFRARVSPKPWRIGITDHLRPRPGVWPVAPEQLPTRRQWVEEYERKATGYASCHFVEEMGNGTVHPGAAAVQRLHDALSRAGAALPLA